MGKGSPLLTAGRESMIFWRDGIMERVGTIVGKTVGNAVGKSTGNVVGTWPGDAVRNGWEHDRSRERGLETLETTNGGKQESDGTECYLAIALSLVVPSTYVRTGMVLYYRYIIPGTYILLFIYTQYYISYISYT